RVTSRRKSTFLALKAVPSPSELAAGQLDEQEQTATVRQFPVVISGSDRPDLGVDGQVFGASLDSTMGRSTPTVEHEYPPTFLDADK
uniref:hypothetical protein n=1 Tax=Paracoccus sp. TRP TaxID=412597 RepID=UPI001ED978EC